MKILIKISVFLFILFAGFLPAQNNFIVGGGANYNIPFGSLSDRFNGNFGGWVYAGKQISEKWTWVGKLEYFKLNEVNEDKMFKVVRINFGGSNKDLTFALPGIKMDFSSFGLTAEAKYNLLKNDHFQTDLNLGFGFYSWEFKRGSYRDSLFADTTGTGSQVLIEIINVPELTQKDWNGGANIGLEFNLSLFEPVFLNLNFNYKLIIAELWPTLDLNLENVSGLQFFDFRAGIILKL